MSKKNSRSILAPININKDKSKNCTIKCPLIFYYRSGSTVTFNRENKQFTFSNTPSSYVTYNSDTYKVEYMKIYSPSEHAITTLNGEKDFL